MKLQWKSVSEEQEKRNTRLRDYKSLIGTCPNKCFIFLPIRRKLPATYCTEKPTLQEVLLLIIKIPDCTRLSMGVNECVNICAPDAVIAQSSPTGVNSPPFCPVFPGLAPDPP